MWAPSLSLAAEDHEGDPYPDSPSEFDREQNVIHSNLSRQELMATTSEQALLSGKMINYLQGQLRSAEVPDGATPRVGSFSSLGG